jgi:putative ABC transport system permease protein
MLVSSSLLEYYGWKVGDTITLHSSTLKTDGTSDWTFHILGTFDFAQPGPPAYFGVINYAYLDEYRVADRGTAETFYVRISDPNRAIAMSAAIDRIFANSAHETRTLSQQARAEAQTKQMGDVEFFTDAIIGVVLFTLMFLTGNTLRQAFQERVREFGVLKTVGYSGGRILGIAYAEALLLFLPPAALGLLIARLLAPLAREDLGVIVVSPVVAAVGLLCAASLAFLGAALPALNLARMPIAAALGKG